MSEDPATAQPTGEQLSAAQLVSQLARKEAQERHEEAQREVRVERPSFVLDIEESDVYYTLPPRVIPLRYVDFDRLSRQLAEKWGLVLDPAAMNYDPLHATIPPDEFVRLTVPERTQLLLKSVAPNLAFRAGKYPVSDFEFVPILDVRINFESVVVKVAGISRVAEVVAAEIMEAIVACSGAVRSWREIERDLQRAGYATRTKVDLGVPFEAFLGPAVRSFLDDEMVEGPKYALHMGHYYARYDLKPPPRATATYALHRLRFQFVWFDPETGVSMATPMNFDVTAKSDFRSRIVSIWSELPYDIHVRALGVLIERLSAQPDLERPAASAT